MPHSQQITISLVIKKFTRLVFLFSIAISVGCVPESENTPSKKHVTSANELMGEYYQEDEQGRRTDLVIGRSGSRDFPYSFRDVKRVGKPLSEGDVIFQTYKIGEQRFMAAKIIPKPNEKRSEHCFLTRFSMTRTQTVIETLEQDFFVSNPHALPGTMVTKTGNSHNVLLRASPDQLSAFLSLHGESKKVFDVKNAILLNRIGT